ncbi:MAG TPA: DUF1801 domain-containing protein [Caulobacteraceae bacterium]
MANSGFKSVDDYIAAQPEAVRARLDRVRGAIRKAVPGAEEVISYKIPAYKLHGAIVVYFAGWSAHYSLYPAAGPVVAAFKRDLAPYEVRKGTIRFPLSQPVPVRLIQRIARFRASEITQRQKTKAKTRPARVAAPDKALGSTARKG